MSKKLLIILLIILLMMALTLNSFGCWNYREVESLAIVSGMAVDKAENRKDFLITIETVQIQGGKETPIKSLRIESTGKTVFDAVRHAIKISAKRLYWPHSEVVIISQEVAREGIISVVDWVNRSSELRLTLNILVSKEKTAKESDYRYSLL